jgi:hypothetical protein
MRGCPFVADRAAPIVLLLRSAGRPTEKWEPWRSWLGCREAFASGGLKDLLIEGCEACLGVFRGSETVGVGQTDGVALSELRRLDGDGVVGKVDLEPERRDRLTSFGQSAGVSRRRDEYLGEIHRADCDRVLALAPFGQQVARPRVLGVAAVQCADEHIGIDQASQRWASSVSS